MATLAVSIDSSVKAMVVSADTGKQPGFRFRLDDELLELTGFDYYPVAAGRRKHPGLDPTRWFVNRAVGGSTAASHTAGATIYAVVSAAVSGAGLTTPDPFPDAAANELSADELAAIQGAASPSALNVFATMADVPVDELTVDELAAIQGAAAPDAGNVFATAADIPSPAISGAWGELTINAGNDTLTLAVQDTWYPVVGDWIAGEVEGMTLDAPNGTISPDAGAEIITLATLSFTTSETANALEFGVFADGVLVPDHAARTWNDSQTYPQSVTITGIDAFTAGQVLDVRARCITASDIDIVVVLANFSLATIGGGGGSGVTIEGVTTFTATSIVAAGATESAPGEATLAASDLAAVLAAGNDTGGIGIASAAADADDADASATAEATGTGDATVARSAISAAGNADASTSAAVLSGAGDADASINAESVDGAAFVGATAEATGTGNAASKLSATATAGTTSLRVASTATTTALEVNNLPLYTQDAAAPGATFVSLFYKDTTAVTGGTYLWDFVTAAYVQIAALP